MPVLPNQRHEAFAQALAKGKSATEAYALAGYKPHQPSASRLLSNAMVQDRLAELQGKVAKKVEVTIESLAAELDEARELAKGGNQPGAMVSATMGKAKLFGKVVEKKQHSGTIHMVTISDKDLDGLTDDELALLEQAYPILQRIGFFGKTAGPEEEAPSSD